ncbi:MAG TPA: sulfate ABC transporter permease subunit CysT [Blastocatellia bacterium]|nr:sulfate ABC transporter permease subunit CysT [Blastocatellia bacterium]
MNLAPNSLDAPRPHAAPSAVLPWGRWGLRFTAALYLGVMIALPLAAILANGLRDGLRAFWTDLLSPAAFAALKLTIILAVIVTLVNAVMGTLTAYVLVRYRFYGRGLLNGLIDMPFAIPTLVTGVMLVALYGPQRTLGAWLGAHGIQVIFATPGIVLALLVITYPFVIRAVQPVLMEAERSEEEAAYTIGASQWTTFLRVVFPNIAPAVITGSLLCFARALGEFGSVVVVAGNIPGRTLTAPVYVFGQIESHNERAASAMSLVLLALSFTLIVTVEWLQSRRRGAYVASDN